MNRNYELVVILDPELKTEEQGRVLGKIEKAISDAEGKISQKKDWGTKELAYPIAKRRTGIFCWFLFSLPAEKISALKQKLVLEEKILRYLLINKGEKATSAKQNKPKEA